MSGIAFSFANSPYRATAPARFVNLSCSGSRAIERNTSPAEGVGGVRWGQRMHRFTRSHIGGRRARAAAKRLSMLCERERDLALAVVTESPTPRSRGSC